MNTLETARLPIIEGSSISNPDSYDKWARKVFDALYGLNETTIVGQENLPKNEPYLITATHRGSGDVPAVVEALDDYGRVRFVAKTGVFRIPIFGSRMRDDWDTIPIKKGQKFGEEVRLKCLSTFHYEEDAILDIFPEGTRVKKDIEEVKHVPAFVAGLACYGNVKVVPMAIWGTHKMRNIPGFSNLVIVIGEHLGPFSIEAGYKLVMDGRDVNMQESSVERFKKTDIVVVRDAQAQIREAMQSCLTEAIALSKS